jgi:hypothetical protein
MKQLAIVGSFDDQNGKKSSYCEKLFNNIPNLTIINGGSYNDLEKILESINDYKVIYWFANVPNDKDKLINQIKVKNQECILISSKNNLDNKYSFLELVSKALFFKSNLFVVFTKNTDNKFIASVYDPLGNEFVSSDNIDDVRHALLKRVEQLLTYTRVSSVSIGTELEVLDEESFFAVARRIAEKLFVSEKEINNTRFLGNLSFRCLNGFNSYKKDSLIYVSRRNIDKKNIDKNGFVPVQKDSLNVVQYYGFKKPSVDTPIQLRLFDYYKNIKYIIHTHSYVKDVPFTKEIIPCGSIEEFDEIKSMFPNKESCNFSVNLKGHGSIMFSDNVDYFETLDIITRQLPELRER